MLDNVAALTLEKDSRIQKMIKLREPAAESLSMGAFETMKRPRMVCTRKCAGASQMKPARYQAST